MQFNIDINFIIPKTKIVTTQRLKETNVNEHGHPFLSVYWGVRVMWIGRVK
jgi:hypothetical protein